MIASETAVEMMRVMWLPLLSAIYFFFLGRARRSRDWSHVVVVVQDPPTADPPFLCYVMVSHDDLSTDNFYRPETKFCGGKLSHVRVVIVDVT